MDLVTIFSYVNLWWRQVFPRPVECEGVSIRPKESKFILGATVLIQMPRGELLF
jgi:hypothetical protein